MAQPPEAGRRHVPSPGAIASLCLASLAGAASILAMAPFHLWPVLGVTLPALVLLLDGAAARHAGAGRGRRLREFAAIGWAFGFGYFLPGLLWIGEAFLVEADKFAWLMPFAVTLMPAGLALFHGAALGAACLLWRPGEARILSLALFLSIAEWLRGHVLTGFPWNDLGLALTGSEALMQAASVTGVAGLTFWTLLALASPVMLMGEMPWQRRVVLPAAMACLLALAAVLGAMRVPEGAAASVDGVRLRIVQPNIPQKEKWQGGNKERIFSTFLSLTGEGGLDGITHVIWPESSLPFLMLQSEEALQRIAATLPDGRVLITGSLRAEQSPAVNGDQGLRVFNSLAAIDAGGKVLSVYDKQHLVPFGEYLPFQATLEAIGLEQLTRQKGGFIAGSGLRRLEVPGVPSLVPLICYEAIFPAYANGHVPRAGWLLNVTNDAWFGRSSGPYQHFHQARLRAVETGLPLVRVANTGISAVVDPYGRVLMMLPLEEAGRIDIDLPRAAGITIYARIGDWSCTVVWLLALCALLGWGRLYRGGEHHSSAN
jgi:apolipoprotein N-acyltransferase